MENNETAGAPEVAPTVQCPNCGYGVTIPQVASGPTDAAYNAAHPAQVAPRAEGFVRETRLRSK